MSLNTAEIRAGTPLAGRYRVLRPAGDGRDGDRVPGRGRAAGATKWRIKRLHTDAPEASLQALPSREAKLGAALNHPNLVAIYDTVAADGGRADRDGVRPRASTLSELAGAAQVKRPSRALPILRSVADALDHAHAEGVVHRDVKPGERAGVRAHGTVKLADLGIARAIGASQITSEGSVVGTLPYMSPERLAGPGRRRTGERCLCARGRRLRAALGAASERGLDGRGGCAGAGRPFAGVARGSRPRCGRAGEGPGRRARKAPTLGGAVRGRARVSAVEGRCAGSRCCPARRRRGWPRRERGRPPDRAPPRARIAGAPAARWRWGCWRSACWPSAASRSAVAGETIRVPGARASSRPRPSRKLPAEEPASAPEEPAGDPQPEPALGEGLDAAALNDLGFALIQDGNYDEAIPVLERAVDSYDRGPPT